MTIVELVVIAALTVLSCFGIRSILVPMPSTSACLERAADGKYVLQRVELRPSDDERMRKIVTNHNQILDLLCGEARGRR